MMNYKLWLRSFLLAIFLFALINFYGARVVEYRHNEVMRLINVHHEFLRIHYPNFYNETLKISEDIYEK